MTEAKDLEILYTIEFSNNEKVNYRFLFDATTISNKLENDSELPDWTKLEQNQCENCPLKSEEYPHCPVAAKLSHMIERFHKNLSHETVKVSVQTADRTYYKETALQHGLSSMFGLIMATSGCPKLDFLKPMARYHLPFASLEETIMRTSSLYLLEQFFRSKRGETPDMQLEKLKERYEDIHMVNVGMSERIRSMIEQAGDAKDNAIIVLDTFAQMLGYELEDDMEMIQYVFAENLEK